MLTRLRFVVFVALVLLFGVVAVANAREEYKSELVLQDPKVIGEHVVSPRPRVTSKGELPVSLDYRAQGLLTGDLNQHIPVYCGSCWAHAALSSIADRLKIASKGMARDVIPSIQALINCGSAGSCNGGDSNAANAWVHKNTIPDVTCQYYQAKNMECSAINTCMTCSSGGGCVAQETYAVIKVTEYGHVEGDEQIQAEILARGPVSAYLNAECILNYTGGVASYDNCNPANINHAIQINGWGVDANGTEYWIGRNSWGRYWGEEGFFRIVRGGKWKVGAAYWAVPEL